MQQRVFIFVLLVIFVRRFIHFVGILFYSYSLLIRIFILVLVVFVN